MRSGWSECRSATSSKGRPAPQLLLRIEEVAQRHSDHPERKRDLGFLDAGPCWAGLDHVVFAPKPGEAAQLLPSAGYHIGEGV